MGAGTRVKQYEMRFGLGQSVDTYGEPCSHAEPSIPTNGREKAEALNYIDIIDVQSSIFWKQAIYEAIQDSNLKELAAVADDLGNLKSYYENEELSLVLMDSTVGGKNMRVTIPPFLTNAMIVGEGPTQVKIINPVTGKAYSFYKVFHNVKDPNIDIPREMTSCFPAGQKAVVMMKQLPIWDFVNQIKGKTSGDIKFNKEGILVADFSSKKIPIESFDFDYIQGRGISGAVYMGFQVRDIAGKIGQFRLYDNGFGEPRLTIKMGGGFCQVEGLKYDPKGDALRIEYNHGMKPNRFATLQFMEPPDEIDFDTHRIPEEMRLIWEKAINSNNTKEMGKLGERVAAKIAEKEYNVKVYPKKGETGPDREITLDSELIILEAKSTADKSELDTRFKEVVAQVKDRNKVGIAISVYINTDTGFFEYKHDIIRPKTRN